MSPLINSQCSVPSVPISAICIKVHYICRPVDCISTKPALQYLPGAIGKTIFSNQPEAGWGVSTYPNINADSGPNKVYAVDQELKTTRLDSNLTTQNGSCFTFPSGKQYSVSFLLPCCKLTLPICCTSSGRSIAFVCSTDETCSSCATRLEDRSAAPTTPPAFVGSAKL